MAVDTETKRRSATGYGVQPLVVYPVANSIIDAYDREHITALYAGILAGEPADVDDYCFRRPVRFDLAWELRRCRI